jgi:hypothetical protein
MTEEGPQSSVHHARESEALLRRLPDTSSQEEWDSVVDRATIHATLSVAAAIREIPYDLLQTNGIGR